MLLLRLSTKFGVAGVAGVVALFAEIGVARPEWAILSVSIRIHSL